LIAGRDVNYAYDFQQFISAPSLVHEVHPHSLGAMNYFSPLKANFFPNNTPSKRSIKADFK
jgi:hypothetical protein